MVTFFKHLFQGYHSANGAVGSEPFKPDFTLLDPFLLDVGALSPNESDNLTKDISLDEVQVAIKESASNKSLGLYGLMSEFYKTTMNLVAPELVSVFNDQLGRLCMIDSNKRGATRLINKVTGTALIMELRPLTLLNHDY